MTLELIVRIKETLSSRCMTNKEFRVILNKHLPASRQIEDDHSGTVKLNRWLNPAGAQWPEPYGEIVLAMQKSLEELSQKTLDV